MTPNRVNPTESFFARMLTQILSILRKNSESEVSQPPVGEPSNLEEKPLSYHWYWMVYAKNILDNSIPEYQQKINNYRSYLNGLSSALFIGGLALTSYLNTSNILVFTLIFGPIVFLQLARYIINVQLDNTDFFQIDDITDAVQVHQAHNLKVEALSKKASNAKLPVGLATLLFLVCVPLGILKQNRINDFSKQNFQVSISKYDTQLNIRAPNTSDPEVYFKGSSVPTQKDTLVVRKLSFAEDGKLTLHFHNQLLGLEVNEVIFRYTEESKRKAYIQKIEDGN